MIYIIPKHLKEEYKIFDKPRVYLKDLVTVGVLVGVFYLFKGTVHSWLMIPYWLCAIFITYFLIQPARSSNPQKRNWEALMLFLGRDRTTYYSLNRVHEEDDHAKQG